MVATAAAWIFLIIILFFCNVSTKHLTKSHVTLLKACTNSLQASETVDSQLENGANTRACHFSE